MSTLKVQIGANISQLEKALSTAQSRLRSFGQSMKQTGRTLSTRLTAPILAMGGATGKLAMDFESSMTKIETLVGLSREQVRGMTQDVLALSSEAGRSPQELAEALFVVTSAGERGAEAMDVLERAAKASASGLGNTREIARSVTSAMQAYQNENLSAARATDIFTAIVREGNLEADQLAGALGRVIGIASQAGVSFEEVGASIATFTRLGVSAEESTTALRGILQALISPSDGARAALDSVGLSVGELRNKIEQDGLSNALQSLVTATDGNVESLSKIIPNIRALSAVMGTAGAQGESYQQIVNNINNSQGLLDEAFERTSETLKNKYERAIASLQKAGIKLGNKLFPIFEKMIENVNKLTNWLVSLNDAGTKLVLTIAGIVAGIGPALLIFGQLTIVISGLLSPIALVSSALVALVGTIIYVKKNSEAFIDHLMFGFTNMKNDVIDNIADMQEAILSWVQFLPGVTETAVIQARAALLSMKDDLPTIENEFQSFGEFMKDVGGDVMDIFMNLTGFDFSNLLGGAGGGGVGGGAAEQVKQWATDINASTRSVAETNEETASRLAGSMAKMTAVTSGGMEAMRAQWQKSQEMAQQAAQVIMNSFINMGVSFFESLGMMLAGSAGMSEVFRSLLTNIADMAIQLGTIIVASGEAIEALKASLISFFGGSAVIAGAALIAIGAAAKGAISAIGRSGGSGGSSSVDQFQRSATSVPSAQDSGGTVTFRIGNNELVGVLQQGSKRDSRVGKRVGLQ